MRYAILGAGYIAPINAAALLSCEDAEIVCIANRTKEKAEAMREKLGLSCPVYTDYKEALDLEKPDVAVICVFNDQHKEYFTECAKRGIHILCEKPLANFFSDCTEMINIRDRYGIKVSVLQTQRYGAVLTTAAAYIDEHLSEFGDLCGIEDNMSCHYFWDGRNPWHLSKIRSGGGIVLNYGVHQLDRVHYMLTVASGEAQTVDYHGSSLVKKPDVEVESSYAMLGRTCKGVLYTIACSGYCGPSVNEMMLHFQNATVKCVLCDNGMDKRGVYVSDGQQFQSVPLICEDGVGGHEMYVREMTEADLYLRGYREEAPVPMEWAAEMVRLSGLALQS